MLKLLGYNPGKVDGFFDQETKLAVVKFQRDQKLKGTGVLEGQTTIRLMQKLRDKIISHDTQVKAAVKELKKQMNQKEKE
jgi:carboxyl-terminal processing protease